MIGGSAGNLICDGDTFPIHNDADLQKAPSVEKESLGTSGESVDKVVKKDEEISGIDVAVDIARNEDLENLSRRNRPFSIAVEYPGGTVLKCKGKIALEGHNSQDEKQTVTVAPFNREEGWTIFAG